MAKEQKSKFMQWYDSYAGKHAVNIIYSAGASVVIIGALFKIMHWPGAGIILTAGMCTEAFLFMIGVLEKPHEEFHWANVFPQLLEYGAPEDRLAAALKQDRPTLLGAGVEDGQKSKTAVPALTDKDMEALKGSINDLAKTAGQLSELGKIAEQTNKLSEKMAQAGEKMEQVGDAAGNFVVSAAKLGQTSGEVNNQFSAVVEGIKGVVNGTKDCQQSVDAMGKKLSEMNAVYELQMSVLKQQTDAFKAQTDKVNAVSDRMNAVSEKFNEVDKDVAKMQAAAAEAVKNQQAYEDGAKQLASKIADLNKIYGNMLTALA